MCRVQPEHSLSYWFFWGLSGSAVIKLRGQTFVFLLFLLFSLSLPWTAVALLHCVFTAISRTEVASVVLPGLYIDLCLSLCQVSPAYGFTSSSARAALLLYNVLGSHEALSIFEELLNGKSPVRKEETLLRNNNWSRWAPQHRCEYDPLLQTAFYQCWSSHGLKLIAKHAALTVGVNILQHFLLSKWSFVLRLEISIVWDTSVWLHIPRLMDISGYYFCLPL